MHQWQSQQLLTYQRSYGIAWQANERDSCLERIAKVTLGEWFTGFDGDTMEGTPTKPLQYRADIIFLTHRPTVHTTKSALSLARIKARWSSITLSVVTPKSSTSQEDCINSAFNMARLLSETWSGTRVVPGSISSLPVKKQRHLQTSQNINIANCVICQHAK